MRKNECIHDWLAIKKMTLHQLADLLGSSAENVSKNLRHRELVQAEKDIIYQAIATGKKQEFRFWCECRRCGEVFERVAKEYLCPACARKANIKREPIKRLRKHQPEFTISQMAIAARKLGLSYGELVDKMSRGLIDREVVEKKIKEK
ncbi:MAG: hypothetical protein J6A61_05920 [Clostridia bacterium]|nr:hypothetical protein [Clostridia bacterium]